VAILTTIIFPFVYVDLPHIIKYYPLVLVRDLLMLAIVLVLLYYATRNRRAGRSQGAILLKYPIFVQISGKVLALKKGLPNEG
jgi:hypothetical protein